jgi:hypothetical protein
MFLCDTSHRMRLKGIFRVFSFFHFTHHLSPIGGFKFDPQLASDWLGGACCID